MKAPPMKAPAEAVIPAAYWKAKLDEIERLRAALDLCVKALEGVITVADRKTAEFDAARAAIALGKDV